MKSVIYCRVSSKEQEETGYSLDAQEKLLAEYAERKGFKVAKIFRVTESASKWQIRKTLNEMLAHAETHGIATVLCEKIDRLTRSLKDAGVVDDWIHADTSREVHFVKENFVLNKNTRAHENLVWDMKVAIARFYTNNLSEEVRKGQKEKVAQGWLPTKPPLGYKTVGEKGHKIHIIDGEVAPYVQRMFEYYASGNYSLKALVEKMYAEGMRTRSGSRVVKSRMADFLKDPFYYGAIRWKDYVYAGQHEPLVTKECFDRVQEILSGKKAPHKTRHKFQFRKMLKCGECEGTITAEIQKGIVYYHCNHYKACSQKKFTPEKRVEEQLFGVFKFFESITTEEAEEIKSKIKQNHTSEIEYKERTIQGLQDRYNALQRRLDNLYNDRLDEKVTVEFWQTKQKEVVAEQTAIQERLAKLKTEEAKYFEIWLNVLDLARRAREIYEKRTPEQRRTLLLHLFSNLSLKDGEVTPVLKKSTAAIAKRVQERLDTDRSFERQKSRSNKRLSATSKPKTSSLLRG